MTTSQESVSNSITKKTEQCCHGDPILIIIFLIIQKYLEYEDAQDQEKRNLQAGMESLELQNKHNESKIKSYIDQCMST